MIKKIINKVLNSVGYQLVKTDKLQQVPIINKDKAIIKKISPDFTILNGPFKGIRYPSLDITELALAPKIAGSYEYHLVPLINELIQTPYDNIIDVGCAEGYYAIGFAKHIPQSTVHCFDINKRDIEFCKKMAELNNVSNLTYNTFCSPDTLINFDYGKKALIFCDCEGYELELFTDKVINALKNVDVLVELHDVVNPAISKTILERFNATHNVKIINNSNVNYSALEGLENISNQEKAFVFYEHRGGMYQNVYMEWAFFTPKK